MKIILFFTTFCTALFAQNYCIYIDKLNTNLDNSKIHSILDDIAYPSVKIQDNKTYIYSGKFKSRNDANKLLALTKSRYKNAAVASCEGATIYSHNTLISDISNKQRIISQIQTTEQEQKNSSTHYCLKILEMSLLESSKKKNEIKEVINKLPNATTKVMNNKFYVYSGNFQSLQSANAILNILKREFKGVSVSTCSVPSKQVKNTNVADSSNITSPSPSQKEYEILALDEKGLLSTEIASSSSANYKIVMEKSDIRHALDSQRGEYFNGLYLKLNTAYDSLNNDTAYDFRVEFDIFEQGYYATKMKNEKDKIDNQIAFYKTLKNIEILKKNQELLKIKKYQNAINVSSLLVKLRITENNLNEAKQKLDNGLITNYEYEEYSLSIQQIKDELLLLKNMTLLKIPKKLWLLLNQIENVRLINQDELLNALEKDSVDFKLAKTIQKKMPYTNKWSDKLRVNIYAGQRKLYLSQQQTLFGVEAKIPLSNYSKTEEIQNVQNKILANQVELQYSQTKESLKDAIATFRYKQQKLKTYSYELSRIKIRLENLNAINSSAFASYANLNFNDEQKAISGYLVKHATMQQERIDTYKELINIMYLIHSGDLKDVLRYVVKN